MQTAVINKIDVRHRKMVWSKFVPAWDAANIVMPSKIKSAHVTPGEMRRAQNIYLITALLPHTNHFQSNTKQNIKHNGKTK